MAQVVEPTRHAAIAPIRALSAEEGTRQPSAGDWLKEQDRKRAKLRGLRSRVGCGCLPCGDASRSRRCDRSLVGQYGKSACPKILN